MRRLLEHVAVRARLEPALEERSLAVGREHEDARVRHAGRDLLGRLDSVHLRHAQVHDHDVGLAALGERDGCLAVGSLAHDADVRRAQQREPQAFADHFVVVRDQDRDLAVFCHGVGFYECGGTPSSSHTASASCFGSGAGWIVGRRGCHEARASSRTARRTGSVSDDERYDRPA